jgi:hypothetical protein
MGGLSAAGDDLQIGDRVGLGEVGRACCGVSLFGRFQKPMPLMLTTAPSGFQEPVGWPQALTERWRVLTIACRSRAALSGRALLVRQPSAGISAVP